MKRRHAGWVLLVAAAPVALAADHIVDIDWSTEGRFAHRAQVAAGKFVEVCGKVRAGEAVRWRFEASAPVDFNIHYHVGRETVYPARQDQVSMGQDVLRVTQSQDHCWMWTNKGSASVALSVALQR